jgi:hypothetical protein
MLGEDCPACGTELIAFTDLPEEALPEKSIQ